MTFDSDNIKELILIVDDDPSFRLMLGEALESTGLRVEEAEDGAQALAFLENNTPDLILLDVMMPDMDGFEVCTRLRKIPGKADIPIVMVTGNDDFASIQRAYDLEITNFIAKPIRWRVLPYQISFILRATRAFSDQKKSENRLRLMAQVFEHSGEAIVITGPDNLILATNSSFTRLTGYSQEDALGQDPKILKSGKEPKEFYVSMWEFLLKDNYWQGEIWDKRKDGSLYPKWLAISVARNDQGEITNYIGSFTDISDRKQAAEKIEHMAYHDHLTNLPNRLSLHERLCQAVEMAKRSASQLAVFFIDLDRFKNINDSLGHHIGDKLLLQVAARLSDTVRSADIVARFGGDEFVIVLPQIRSEMVAAHIVDKIRNVLSQAYQLEGHNLHVTPSIGISVFPQDGETVEDLVKNADLAMYHAKYQGRNNYQFFKPKMNSTVHERLLLESDLLAAIEHEEFLLHYQPQIDMATGLVIGVEALVRWQHPQRGLLLPDTFISIAEDTGLILPIGNFVIKTASRQLKSWLNEGLPPIRMAVNLSLIHI